MGLLSKAFDFAKKTGLLKKAQKLVSKHGGPAGILGKAMGVIGRYVIPEPYRNIGSTVADTALSMMPDSPLKKTLMDINNGAQNRKIVNNAKSNSSNNNYRKVSKKELKYLKKMRRKDGEANYNSADAVIVKGQTPYGMNSKKNNKSFE